MLGRGRLEGRHLAATEVEIDRGVDGQARGDVPSEALNVEGDTAVRLGSGRETEMETQAGNVAWRQPVTRLAKAQRDFFPSSQSAGRGC